MNNQTKAFIYLIVSTTWIGAGIAQDTELNTINEFKPLEEVLSEGEVAIEWENPPGSLPPHVEFRIATLATPSLAIAEAGTTVREALLEACPGAGYAYFDAFEKISRSLQYAVELEYDSLNSVVPEPTLFLLPACIGSSFQEVTVRSNRLPWDIYNETSDGENIIGRREWNDFEQATRSANFDIDLDNIPDGHVLKIPPRIIRITAPVSHAQQLSAILSSVPGGGRVSIVPVFEEGSVEAAPTTDATCSPNKLDDIYESENSQYSEMIKSIVFSVEIAKDPSPATILIADAGLRRIAHPLMAKLARAPLNNSNIEQVYQLPRSTIQATGCYRGPSRTHGEAVLGVAMGGFHAALPNSLFSPIRVLVHNTYTDFIPRLSPKGNICIEVQPKANDLLVTLNELAPQSVEVDVVNLSQSWAHDDAAEPLKKMATSNSASFLLVAAAGNKAQDLDITPTYPSAYGSGEDSRIIVVAALHDQNKLLPESSFNKETVDIAANGCNIPTIYFNEPDVIDEDEAGFQAGELGIGFASGTSFAAPKVSYTAAMIKYLAGDNVIGPVRLKHRLIYSADIRGELFEKVRHGRVLNTAKALSLYHDVVTLVGQEAVLHRGVVKLDDPDDGRVQVCPTWETERSNLLKISKINDGDMKGKYLIYYREGGVFKNQFCNSVGDIFFSERSSPSSDAPFVEIKGSQIQDVVFREF